MPDLFGFPGTRNSGLGTYQPNLAVSSPSLLITRPNNATPYASTASVGKVYGDATDARNSLVVPPMPANSRSKLFSLSMGLVEGCAFGSGAASFGIVMFASQPSTVIGDGASLSLSDADIALIPSGQISTNAAWVFPAFDGTAVSVLNSAATAAGRRGLVATVLGGGSASETFTPGATVWFYLQVIGSASYTPTALGTVRLFPAWVYSGNIPS